MPQKLSQPDGSKQHDDPVRRWEWYATSQLACPQERNLCTLIGFSPFGWRFGTGEGVAGQTEDG